MLEVVGPRLCSPEGELGLGSQLGNAEADDRGEFDEGLSI